MRSSTLFFEVASLQLPKMNFAFGDPLYGDLNFATLLTQFLKPQHIVVLTTIFNFSKGVFRGKLEKVLDFGDFREKK